MYDLLFLEQRFDIMKKNLNAEIHYAMKANANIKILKNLKRMGSYLDVVSIGEVRRGLDAGFSPQQMIFSGVAKTEKEIKQAIDLKIQQINVESISELQRISRCALEMKKKISIALRINPNVNIKTHPYIATGLLENKFGMSPESLSEAIEVIRKSKYIQLVGVSMHLGSQMHDLSAFEEGLLQLKKIFLELRKDFPQMKVFDVGGGLGIFYEHSSLDKEEKMFKKYAQIISKNTKDMGVTIQIEPGRWIVGHIGVLVSQVQYIKSHQKKNFMILDSGMNHLLRPTLYNAYHEIQPLKLIKKSSIQKYDVVGPICETGDFFAKNRNLPIVQEGDWVAILDCGAYGYSMSNQYNLHELPLEKCF